MFNVYLFSFFYEGPGMSCGFYKLLSMCFVYRIKKTRYPLKGFCCTSETFKGGND